MMVLITWIYLLGICLGGCILWEARKHAKVQQGNNVSLLQGLGMIAWGIGHLLLVQSWMWVQNLSVPVFLGFYVLFLWSLHRFPLPASLSYERWKAVMDLSMLIGIYVVIAIYVWMSQDIDSTFIAFMQLYSGLLLFVPALCLLAGNEWTAQSPSKTSRRYLLLVTIGFLVVVVIHPYLQVYARDAALLTASIGLWLGHRRYGNIDGNEALESPYEYLYAKLKFSYYDGIVIFLLMIGTAACLILIPDIPFEGKVGLALGILLCANRFFLSKRANHQLLKDLFISVNQLEENYSAQLLALKEKNTQLTQLLGLNRNYEFLLNARNDIQIRPVTADSLQELVEELVGNWYSRVHTITFLRLTLESDEGVMYHGAQLGAADHPGVILRATEQMKVDDLPDPMKSIRFVTLTAEVKAGESGEKELDPTFFRFLLLHVHDYILRCLDDRRSAAFRGLEKEMELAQRLQSLLVPREQLTLDHLIARTVYSPVTYVGGDYIDYIRMDERYTCFIVADVSGHGLPASLLATGIRSAVRAVLQKSCAPDEILGRLNQLLYDDLSKTRSFITMLVMVYDGAEHKLRLSRAGHPQPLYVSATKQVVLPCAGGVGLGLLPNSSYTCEDLSLDESAMMLVYTDGLLDRGASNNQAYSKKWLEDLTVLLGNSAVNCMNAMDRVEAFLWEKTRNEQQTDDISVLIMQFQSLENDPYVHGDRSPSVHSSYKPNATLIKEVKP